MIKEIALADLDTTKKAIKAGANRIELNKDLSVGGLTPDRETWKEVLNLNVPLVVMVRPRSGNFHYSDDEIQQMKKSIKELKEDGVDTVTFGALTKDNRLDVNTMKGLVELASPMKVVMHMAFDDIGWDNQLEAISQLADMGVIRILTHGGPLDRPITETIDHLQDIVQWANGKIEILPGGGVNFQNASVVSGLLGVDQVHGSKIVEMN